MAINRHHVFVAVCLKFQSDHAQWCSMGEGGIWPGTQALEAHQHTLFRHLFFSRNLGQNIA